MIEEAKREDLPAPVRVELAIVESGIYADQGKNRKRYRPSKFRS